MNTWCNLARFRLELRLSLLLSLNFTKNEKYPDKIAINNVRTMLNILCKKSMI